ncbi:M48 family metallopeptidase [Sorangium sp. So ce834]|uniref:M48 family metalloprotease n=1 Tax=Sorangium sp. So ce834 TaxID=3133321 RepID=UPI003F62EA9A
MAAVRPRGLAHRAAWLLGMAVGFYLLAAGIALGLLWVPYAQSEYGDGIEPSGFLCGAGALWVAWGLVPRRPRAHDPGVPLGEGRHPRLQSLIRDVAARAGHATPADIHLFHDANAFTAVRREAWLRSRTVVGAGLPLLAWLSRSELESVIAHEFGHHVSGDLALGPWVHRTRRTIGGALDHLDGSSFWLHLPFVAYAELFVRSSSGISRAQELEADAVAARIAGRGPTARALRITHEKGPLWSAYLEMEVLPVVSAGRSPPLLEGFRWFEGAVTAEQGALAERRAERAGETSSVYDTHPSLSERLAALGAEAGGPEPGAHCLDLLDDVVAAEEAVLRSLLVDPSRPLPRITWADVTREVWLPRWRQQLEAHREHFRELRPSQLPEALAQIDAWAERTRVGLALLSPAAERRRVTGLFSVWLAVALAELGFELDGLPGAPVRARRGEQALEPFLVVRRLLDGKIDAGAWRARCAEAGVP